MWTLIQSRIIDVSNQKKYIGYVLHKWNFLLNNLFNLRLVLKFIKFVLKNKGQFSKDFYFILCPHSSFLCLSPSPRSWFCMHFFPLRFVIITHILLCYMRSTHFYICVTRIKKITHAKQLVRYVLLYVLYSACAQGDTVFYSCTDGPLLCVIFAFRTHTHTHQQIDWQTHIYLCVVDI